MEHAIISFNVNPPIVHQRCIYLFDVVCSLGNKLINEIVNFIQETLPFIKKDKQTSFLMKHEDLAVLYNLPLTSYTS